MVAYTKEQAERNAQLAADLGNTKLAIRAASAIVREMNIDTLEGLREYCAQVGEFVFRYELRDLRQFGDLAQELVLGLVGVETDT